MYNKVRVDSSNVDTVQLVTEQNLNTGVITFDLEVQFLHGGLYKYLDVGVETYNQMIQSESVGRFLNQNVKEIYEFVRIS